VLQRIPEILPIAVPVRASRVSELSSEGFTTASSIAHARSLGARSCIIATDTGRHYKDAQTALKNGLSLLVEKPMCIDAEQADRLHRLSIDTGKSVFVGCVLRFSLSLNRFREYIPKVGSIHSVRIECQSYLPEWRSNRPYNEAYSGRGLEGGVLRDLIHEIDYAGWILGWPESVHGDLRNTGRLQIEAEESANLAWRSPEGANVSITLDYLTRPSRRRMLACGEHGTLEWNGITDTVTLSVPPKASQIVTCDQSRDAMLQLQDEAFMTFNASGNPDPKLSTSLDGVRALAVCDAARRSSASRREEAVLYP